MPASQPSPGIGHNGPPDPGFRSRRILWARAKADLHPAPLSPATVRMRMARAADLGLSYAQYASIRLATGRDPRALMFSPAGLALRLGRRLDLPPARAAKLAQVRSCRLLVLSPEDEPPASFLGELREISGLPFDAAASAPRAGAGWGRIRDTLLPLLSGHGLPSGTALVIGPESGPEPGWAAAIGAPFLDSTHYFAA